MHTDLLPSHKSGVGNGVGWGIKVHVHVHTSSTLTSHPAILVDTSGVRQGYVRGGWGGALTFM